MKKYYFIIIIIICLLTVSYGQNNIYYEVVYSEGINSNGEVMDANSRLNPGDSLWISSGGRIGLISNYYHTLELTKAGLSILPSFDVTRLSEAWHRPKFSHVLDTIPFVKGQPIKAGLSQLAVLWPDQSPHGYNDQPCLMWELLNESLRDPSSRVEIEFATLYDEPLEKIRMDSSLFLLDVDNFPHIKKQLDSSKILLAHVYVLNEFGISSSETAAVQIDSDQSKIRPINPCNTETALEFMAMAIYLEYNFSPDYAWTRYFYNEMKSSGNHPVFDNIWENYKTRTYQD